MIHSHSSENSRKNKKTLANSKESEEIVIGFTKIRKKLKNEVYKLRKRKKVRLHTATIKIFLG